MGKVSWLNYLPAPSRFCSPTLKAVRRWPSSILPEMPAFLARHHAILHEAVEAHHGHVFQIIGDAFCAAFHTASDALNTALDAQRGLQHEAWQTAPVKVRMGLHTGAAKAGANEERAGGTRAIRRWRGHSG